MKKFILFSLFTLFLLKSYAQFGFGHVNFDDTVNLNRIYIDTTIPNNIWQIGAPHKSVFTSAHSVPNAIVTDTVNSYPVNNNSVFYYRTSGDFNTDIHVSDMSFWYRMDCDTLTDFGKLEVSIDMGQTWINLVSGPWYSYWTVYDSSGQMITQSGSGDSVLFTGSSNGWYHFVCSETLPDMYLDSIIYRYSFHSSGISAGRDGWMIDDIQFNTWWETISDKKADFLVYPNPCKDLLTFTAKIPISEIDISNALGLTEKKVSTNQLQSEISVADLNPGIYFCKIRFLSGKTSFGKFVKI
jgi:hypothetical protein